MTQRLRLTLLIPAVCVGLYLVLRLLTSWFPIHLYVFLVQLVSLTGSALAATSFARGDYLRLAWGLYMVGDLVFLVLAAVNTLWTGQLIGLRLVLMLAANVAGPVGSYLFGAAWSQSGLDARWSRRWGLLVGFVVGLVVGGPALYAEIAAAARGSLEMLAEAIGTAADIANLTFTAPIILTAFALRGGQVAWVWSLLSASLLLWLGYDIVTATSGGADGVIPMGFQVAAMSFTGAAGFAQRIVTRPPPE